MLDELKPHVGELAEHRERFAAYLAQLDDATLNTMRGDDEYSPRQALAHLVGACASMVQIGRKMLAGENPRLREDFDLDFYNRRQQEKRAGKSVAELLADWEAAQVELVRFMQTLGAQDLEKRGQHPVAGDTDLRGLIRVIVAHEVEHMERIMRTPA